MLSRTSSPVLPFLALAFVLVATLAIPAFAEEPGRELASGTVTSTDLNADGSTGLADLAIFGCAFFQAASNDDCPCTRQHCSALACDPGCPLALPGCNCNGTASWKSDFDCLGYVGLGDLAIIAQHYLTGTVGVFKCQ